MKTNYIHNIAAGLAILSASTYLTACTADTDAVNMVPEIETGNTISTTRTSATVSGTVNANASVFEEYGIAYSSSSQMYDSRKIRCEEQFDGKKTFNVFIDGLSSGTTYFYRTYVISGGAYAYGDYKMFQTPSISAPTIEDITSSDVNASQATITAAITDKGVSEDVKLDLSTAMIKYKRLGNSSWSGDLSTLNTSSSDWQSTNAELIENGSKTSIKGTITGLTSSSTYAVYASAICAGEGRSSIITVVTAETSNPELSGVSYTEAEAGLSLNISASVTNPGKAEDGGQATVISRGFVYSTTNPTPEIEGSTAIAATGNDSKFTATLDNLSYSTTYYIRAYAQNAVGYGYGSVLEYTTADVVVVPYIHTVSLTDVTYNSVKLIGYLNSNGVQVSQHGFIFNGQRIPVADGEGTFEYTVTGLTPLTEYSFRTYCIEASGTEHQGAEVTFKTEAAPPSIDDILFPGNK